MSIIQVIAVAAAGLLALSPALYKAAGRMLPAVDAGPSFQSAVSDLACVRRRLSATALLGEEQKKAIDTLTLALVAGSDQ